MNDVEIALRLSLAKYKEACIRADDQIAAQAKTISAYKTTVNTQQQMIELLHQLISKMEGQIEELRAAL